MNNRQTPPKISEEELEWYRKNPDEIELLLDEERVRSKLIGGVLVLAIVMVAGSKLLISSFPDPLEALINQVIVDLVFEAGAAMMGAVATWWFIEASQARQYRENLARYREVKAILEKEGIRP